MKRLIIHGDPGIRKNGVIEYDGGERVVFQATRNGDWHGPEELQLWCILGEESERAAYETQDYIPHFLDVETIDADDVTVKKRAGDLAV